MTRPDPAAAHAPRRTLLDEVTAHEATMERLKSVEDAFERFVPRQFLQLMGFDDIRQVRLGDQVERPMTILFADICDFTNLSESITPQENFNFLNSYLSQMQPAISAHGGVIDKYVGDAILALFPGSTDDALRGAVAILNQLDIYNAGRRRAGYIPIRIGIGVNTGIVMLGTIGSTSRMDVTVIGDAVNLAARLERITRDWDLSLVISEHTVLNLIDPEPFGIRFLDRLQVKGKQEIQSIYEVFDADPVALRNAKRATRKQFETALACWHLGFVADAQALLRDLVEQTPEDLPARLYLERRDCAIVQPKEVIRPWLPDYENGIAEMDRDHRELLTLTNELVASLIDDRFDTLDSASTQLGEALDAHFEREENIMVERDFPFATEHAREHRRTRQQFRQLVADISSGDDARYLAFTTQRLIADWLIDHDLKADRALAHHLQRQGSSI
jgi:hemerythrin